jgi:hypothetical protein
MTTLVLQVAGVVAVLQASKNNKQYVWPVYLQKEKNEFVIWENKSPIINYKIGPILRD